MCCVSREVFIYVNAQAAAGPPDQAPYYCAYNEIAGIVDTKIEPGVGVEDGPAENEYGEFAAAGEEGQEGGQGKGVG